MSAEITKVEDRGSPRVRRRRGGNARARERESARREAKGDARRYAALLWRHTVRVRGRAGLRTPVPSSFVRFPHFERTSGSVLTF